MSGNKTWINQKLIFEVKGLSKKKIERKNQPFDAKKLFKMSLNGKEIHWELCVHFFVPHSNGCIALSLDKKKNELPVFDARYAFGMLGAKEDNYSVGKDGDDYCCEKEIAGGGCWLPLSLTSEQIFDPINGYFNNGAVTFFCDITISIPLGGRNQKDPAVETFKANIMDTSKIFNTDDYCSLVTNDGHSFTCHKSVLAAHSPVFKEIFVNMKGASNSSRDPIDRNTVKIEDFDSETMTKLIEFAYGLLKKPCLHKVDFIAAADKYQMLELKNLLLIHFLDSVTQENVLQTLIVTEKVSGTEELFDRCLTIIGRHYNALSKTPEWKALSQTTLLKIVDQMMSSFKSSNHICRSTTV